jgi:hypothetical protein
MFGETFRGLEPGSGLVATLLRTNSWDSGVRTKLTFMLSRKEPEIVVVLDDFLNFGITYTSVLPGDICIV